VLARALSLFEDMLKILHPVMPFITEEIWQLLKSRMCGESFSITSMPELNESLIDIAAEEEMDFIQNVVTAVRNIRGEMNIPPSKKINLFIKSDKVKESQINYIKSLGRVEEFNYSNDLQKPKASASSVVKDAEIYIPLEGLIDISVERERLEKEINRLSGMLTGVEKKLSNDKFVNNAPADVVEKEKQKKENWLSSIEKLKSILSDLS
jgi:valyl-tRNA synthetase